MKPNDPRFPPLPDREPPFPTEPPAPDTPLVSLVPWWLSVECACRAHAYLPFRRLAAEMGWQTPLSAVIRRLRCERCGERPTVVEIVDEPARKRESGQRFVRVGP